MPEENDSYNRLEKRMQEGFERNRTEIAEVREDISNLKEDVSNMKEDISIMKEDISDLKTNVSRVEHELSRKIDDLRTQLSAEMGAFAREIINAVGDHFAAAEKKSDERFRRLELKVFGSAWSEQP